jgi:hypothetical protein
MTQEFPEHELLEHMRHSLHLAEQRLNNLNEAREPHLKPILDAEIRARKHCLENFHSPGNIAPKMLSWWEYTNAHARLQILRNRREGGISEEEFHARCTILRREREAKLGRSI